MGILTDKNGLDVVIKEGWLRFCMIESSRGTFKYLNRHRLLNKELEFQNHWAIPINPFLLQAWFSRNLGHKQCYCTSYTGQYIEPWRFEILFCGTC